MSLQLAAQHLSTKGRGPDDTLVHMSRGEVKSLNDLAMAHGGHLTINPETGLPEAGFLSSLLPMIAGAALNVAMPGSGMLVPALVGGASMLLNPKAGLMGGLMAGMGAYGGMNLGSALAESGMQQAGAEELAKSQAGISNVVGDAATKGIPANVTQDQYVKSVLAQTQPYVDARTAAQMAFDTGSVTDRLGTVGQGAKTLASPGGFSNLYQNLGSSPMSRIGTVAALASPALTQQAAPPAPVADKDMGQRYTYSPGVTKPIPTPDVPTYEDMLTKQGNFGKQQNYYPNQSYTKVSSDEAKNIYGFAGGGPVERMSNDATTGQNTMYPMANMTTSAFSTPYQSPQSTNMIAPSIAPAGGGTVNMMSGEPNMQGTRLAEGGEATPGYTYDAQAQKYISSAPTVPMMPTGAGAGIGSAMGMTYNPLTQRFTGGGGGLSSDQIYLGNGQYGLNEAGRKAAEEAAAAASTGYSSEGPSGDAGGYANGGISDAGYNLGGYSDGGRLLRGPGDGVSDSIPAMIGKKQPARLADGEFVVPARIVSEIGNGSTEAGARKLYAMMDRVQASRKNTIGKGKVAKNNRADKYLPA